MTDTPYIGNIVEAAIPEIVEAVGEWGVYRVTWFQSWVYGYPVIWLVTNTDAEKAAVQRHGCFWSTVRDALLDAGLDPVLADQAHVTVESEERVTRDCKGSWFYAMK